jgi:hypothetical protein
MLRSACFIQLRLVTRATFFLIFSRSSITVLEPLMDISSADYRMDAGGGQLAASATYGRFATLFRRLQGSSCLAVARQLRDRHELAHSGPAIRCAIWEK